MSDLLEEYEGYIRKSLNNINLKRLENSLKEDEYTFTIDSSSSKADKVDIDFKEYKKGLSAEEREFFSENFYFPNTEEHHRLSREKAEEYISMLKNKYTRKIIEDLNPKITFYSNPPTPEIINKEEPLEKNKLVKNTLNNIREIVKNIITNLTNFFNKATIFISSKFVKLCYILGIIKIIKKKENENEFNDKVCNTSNTI